MQTAITSIADILSVNKLDGIDLDIENYITDPKIVATWISNLKAATGSFLTIAP
jgi:hypothetical protein